MTTQGLYVKILVLIREFAINCCLGGDEDSIISFYYSTLRKNVKIFGQVNWVLRRWGRKIKSYMFKQRGQRHKRTSWLKEKKKDVKNLLGQQNSLSLNWSIRRKNRLRVKDKIMDKKRH